MNEPMETTKLKLRLIKVLNEIRYENISKDESSLFDNYPDDIKSKYKKLREELDAKKLNHKNITQEQKNFIETVLITHYLWYVCNLQMKVGGKLTASYEVFSRMAESFVEHRARFAKGYSFDDWFRSFCNYGKSESGEKIAFYFRVPGKTESKFTARYMGRAVPPIYRFLSFLKDRDIFSVFLAKDCDTVLTMDNVTNKYLLKVFKDLDENSYFTKYKGEEGNFSVASKEYRDFFGEKKSGSELFKKKDSPWTYKSRRYVSKRLWTCLIDFFARGKGWTPLVEAVIGHDALAKLVGEKDGFELPGDTHNDSLAFAECVWGGGAIKGWERKEKEGKKGKKLPAPKIRSSHFVRHQYEIDVEEGKKTEKLPDWRPVDYEVTFTYTQNDAMRCDEKKKTECTACPIGNKFKYDDWDKLCHKKEGIECGYVKKALKKPSYRCRGKDKCQILSLVNKIHPKQ